jgi:hypothetical protein
VSPNQVNPSWLRGSGVSLLLSDSRLPQLGKHLWTEALPLGANVGCRPPRRLGKPSKEWTSSILPWNHALCGGGFCCVWKTSPSDTYNRRLGHILVLSSASLTSARVDPVRNNGGGRTYKAPHKASPYLDSMAWRWSFTNLWSDHFCCYVGLKIFVKLGPMSSYTIRVSYRICYAR